MHLDLGQRTKTHLNSYEQALTRIRYEMLRKPLLTTHEVAELLKIKEATVRKWIRDGELSAVNLGRDWRVAVIQLEQFLKLRATGEPTVPGASAQGNNLGIRNAEEAASGPRSTKRNNR